MVDHVSLLPRLLGQRILEDVDVDRRRFRPPTPTFYLGSSLSVPSGRPGVSSSRHVFARGVLVRTSINDMQAAAASPNSWGCGPA